MFLLLYSCSTISAWVCLLTALSQVRRTKDSILTTDSSAMHTYIALILAATLFQNHIVAAAASYWIDQSCITKNANFAATVAESMNMASSAASKNQAGDADLEYIARYIFNMNSLSAAAQIQKNYKLRSRNTIVPSQRFSY